MALLTINLPRFFNVILANKKPETHVRVFYWHLILSRLTRLNKSQIHDFIKFLIRLLMHTQS